MMKNLIGKVHDSMYRQCKSRGFAAPADVLMDIGVLDKKKYDDWRHGRVPYLEAVCTVNLHKLSEIMKEVRAYAAVNGLKPSFTDYRQVGSKDRKLRFSKSGNPAIEKAYATHYVVVNVALSRRGDK
jgi:hypothetical protein